MQMYVYPVVTVRKLNAVTFNTLYPFTEKSILPISTNI